MTDFDWVLTEEGMAATVMAAPLVVCAFDASKPSQVRWQIVVTIYGSPAAPPKGKPAPGLHQVVLAEGVIPRVNSALGKHGASDDAVLITKERVRQQWMDLQGRGIEEALRLAQLEYVEPPNAKIKKLLEAIAAAREVPQQKAKRVRFS